jgi:predicted phosphodiesterase
VYLNPGSAALPKEGQEKSYMVYENGFFSIKNLAGKVLLEYRMEGNK